MRSTVLLANVPRNFIKLIQGWNEREFHGKNSRYFHEIVKNQAIFRLSWYLQWKSCFFMFSMPVDTDSTLPRRNIYLISNGLQKVHLWRINRTFSIEKMIIILILDIIQIIATQKKKLWFIMDLYGLQKLSIDGRAYAYNLFAYNSLLNLCKLFRFLVQFRISTAT